MDTNAGLKIALKKKIFFAGLLLITSIASVSTAQKTDQKHKAVFITRKGNKYHRDSCRYLSKSKIAISLEEAKKYYQPCLVCKPDRLK